MLATERVNVTTAPGETVLLEALNVLVIETSTTGVPVAVAVAVGVKTAPTATQLLAELLVVTISPLTAATRAVLRIEGFVVQEAFVAPVPVTVTLNVKGGVVLELGAIAGTAQVTVPLENTHPALAALKVTPAGSESVRLDDREVTWPELVTFRV